MAEILAVREELADLNAQFDVRSQIRYYYDSDKEKFAKLCGKIAALKVRLAHLETITRKVETSV